jgi:Rho-type GTPase-activating protein 1/2
MSADSTYIAELETPPSEIYSELPAEVTPRTGSTEDASNHTIKRREQSPAIAQSDLQGSSSHHTNCSPFANAELLGTLALPPNSSKNNRNSTLSQRSDQSGAEEFLIPLAFDPTPPAAQSPRLSSQRTNGSTIGRSRDYFGAKPLISSSQKSMADKPTSHTSSPHIAFQEIGRQMQPNDGIVELNRTRNDGTSSVPGSASASPQVGLDKHRRQFAESPRASQSSREGTTQNDRFKLQEVPKTKRSGGSARSSKSEAIASHSDPSAALNGNENETKLQKVKDVQPTDAALTEEPESLKAMTYGTPRISQDYQRYESGEPEAVHDSETLPHPNVGQLHDLPKRGDSLLSSKIGQTIPRKELPASTAVPLASGKASGEAVENSAKSAGDDVSHSTKVNGGKVISNPIESPMSKSILDTPNQSQSRTDKAGEETLEDSFVAPRAPPIPPSDAVRTRNGSLSTFQPDVQRTMEQPLSPSLLRYSAGGDFSLDEDMARILGGDESSAPESFLRRVSNSVRHGRSFSDKGTRLSREQRWPRSPAAGSGTVGHEISSPSTASPEHRDELAWFRNELRREKQKTVEREQKIAELEAALESMADIKQVNTELREKRSTMVVLDTQKEIVVRELEVLTEHIAAAKWSGDPLDLGKMRNVVLRDFAEALQRLKDSFAPQIEDSIQKRNDLVDEIASLTQMKDKSFQEFEQLSLKNAQLADLNNLLVHQIQELYKANSGAATDSARQAPNGLGIYSHHKDKSQVSIDSREARTAFADTSIPGSGTTLQQEEAEPVTVLQGPQVVNIRKGQPKKFNWKKGGQNVAKGVTKGLKGAFSSTQQSYSRELQFAETTPYGTTLPGQEYASIPRTGNEPVRQGFGLFGNPKAAPKGNAPWKTQLNGSSSALPLDASTCTCPDMLLVFLLIGFRSLRL